ncbi:MAG TPA: hypothetical protein PK771_03855 [Spirochaetota bacterium]|nr:hypothetical protein [Spirochaetota bacterium]
MKEKIKTKKILEIEEIVRPIVEEKKFLLVDVDLIEGNDPLVTLFIYNPSDTTVESLGKINKFLYPILEKLSFLKDGFSLEVSSPGLYRTINCKNEFDIFKGREVKVVCEDGLVLNGIIKNFDNNDLIIILKTKEEMIINLDKIKKATLNG